MKEFNLNYEEIKEIRKALAIATNSIDIIENEEKFYFLESLYDKFRNAEESIEEEEEEIF